MSKYKLTIVDEDEVLINTIPAQPEDGFEEGTKVTINVKYGPVGNLFGAINGGDPVEIIPKAVFEVTMDSDKTVKLYPQGVEPSAVASPKFSAPSGDIGKSESVTITCETSGSTIYYTTDGTIPSKSSTQYTSPIVITTDVTIKAIAYATIDEEEVESDVSTATYKAIMPTVKTPVITPASGKVAIGSKAIITCETDGAEIHYTVNGDEPSASSPKYTSEIEITDGMTIKAIAVKAEYNDSAKATASYTIAYPSYYGFINGTEWGTDESRLDAIKALTAEVQNNVECTIDYAIGDAQLDGAFTVYAYPKSIGSVAHIKDKVAGVSYDDSVTRSDITLNGVAYELIRLTDYTALDIGDVLHFTYSASVIS